MKNYVFRLGLLWLLAFTACSDDEKTTPTPLPEFKTIDNSSLNLAGANLYLQSSNTFTNDQGTFDTRYYYISDGIYNGGEPYSLDSYTNASYLIEVDLNVPSGNDFAAGNFPLRYDYSLAPAGSNFSYIILTTDTGDYYESYDIESPAPVKISGGFEDGETMTIEYDGMLKFYEFLGEGEGWAEGEAFDGKFYFQAQVDDQRPS